MTEKTFPKEICSLVSNDKDQLNQLRHMHINTMKLLKTMA